MVARIIIRTFRYRIYRLIKSNTVCIKYCARAGRPATCISTSLSSSLSGILKHRLLLLLILRYGYVVFIKIKLSIVTIPITTSQIIIGLYLAIKHSILPSILKVIVLSSNETGHIHRCVFKQFEMIVWLADIIQYMLK